MRAAVPVMAACGVLLSACSGDEQPADPPEPEDALTATPTAVPTAAPDDESVTTEASEATSSPSDEDAAIPEMPEEAKENTEEGAEAFARHYIDLVNATGMNPETGVLEPLSAEGCESCANYEANVASLASQGHHNSGPAASVEGAVARDLGNSFRVEVDVTQLPLDVLDRNGEVVNSYERIEGQGLVFSLTRGDGWLVEEITVSQ